MALDELKQAMNPNERPVLTVIIALVTGSIIVLTGAGLLNRQIAAGARAELATDLATAKAARDAIDRRVGELEIAQHQNAEKLDHLAEQLGDVKSDVRVIRATVTKDRP